MQELLAAEELARQSEWLEQTCRKGGLSEARLAPLALRDWTSWWCRRGGSLRKNGHALLKMGTGRRRRRGQ